MCKKCAERYADYPASLHAVMGNSSALVALAESLHERTPSVITTFINDSLPDDEKAKARAEANEVDGAVKVAMLLGFMIGHSDAVGTHANVIQAAVEQGIEYAVSQQGAAEEAVAEKPL